MPLALLLSVVAGLGLLALKRRASSSGTSSLPVPGSPTDPHWNAPIVGADQSNQQQAVGIVATTAKQAASTLATAGPVAAAGVVAGAATAGAAELANSLLGGGTAGRVASTGVWTFGSSFTAATGGAVGGAAIGREVDKLLGGTGEGIRGYTAMALGGVVGAAFCCAGTVVGYCFLAVAAIIFTLVIFIDDGARQEWVLIGGPEREYQEAWQKLHDKIVETLTMGDIASTPEQRERFATLFADGHQRQVNRINYNMAMAKAWGIGATRESHARHQRSRGFFMGEVLPGGDLDDSLTPYRRGREEAWINRWVPMDQRIRIGSVRRIRPELVPVYERLKEDLRSAKDGEYGNSIGSQQGEWDSERGSATRHSETSDTGAAQAALDAFTGNPANYYDAPVWKDLAEDLIEEAAAVVANATSYADWMQGTWGVGQSETSHGAYGRNEGRFEGYFEAVPPEGFRFLAAKGGAQTWCSGKGGLLVFRGHRIYWRDEASDAGPFPEIGQIRTQQTSTPTTTTATTAKSGTLAVSRG